jgi:hypothetical protein
MQVMSSYFNSNTNSLKNALRNDAPKEGISTAGITSGAITNKMHRKVKIVITLYSTILCSGLKLARSFSGGSSSTNTPVMAVVSANTI